MYDFFDNHCDHAVHRLKDLKMHWLKIPKSVLITLTKQ